MLAFTTTAVTVVVLEEPISFRGSSLRRLHVYRIVASRVDAVDLPVAVRDLACVDGIKRGADPLFAAKVIDDDESTAFGFGQVAEDIRTSGRWSTRSLRLVIVAAILCFRGHRHRGGDCGGVRGMYIRVGREWTVDTVVEAWYEGNTT